MVGSEIIINSQKLPCAFYGVLLKLQCIIFTERRSSFESSRGATRKRGEETKSGANKSRIELVTSPEDEEESTRDTRRIGNGYETARRNAQKIERRSH